MRNHAVKDNLLLEKVTDIIEFGNQNVDVD